MYVDYEKHQCTLRKEINEIKLQLKEMNDAIKQISAAQAKVANNLKAHDQSIKNLQDPLCSTSSAKFKHKMAAVNGQIFIFGGEKRNDARKSFEVFNWSTKTWTLVKDCLFFQRFNSYSFLHGKKMMLCGGTSTNRIEFFTPRENGFTSCVFPGSLPHSGIVIAVLFGNRLISFSNKVEETQLESPWETNILVKENYTGSGRCGVERFGNDIFVVGDSNVERYDTVRNELKLLPSLPYSVINMATVAYKDNIIIFLGLSTYSNSLHFSTYAKTFDFFPLLKTAFL